MAINYSKINIKRTGGLYPSNRYGIVLSHLPKSFRQFLVEHRHIKKWAASDQFVECALKMQRPPIKNTQALKIYYDWKEGQPVSYEGLEKSYNTVDWACAISLKPIKAKFMNFDLENFVHPEYYDVLKAPMVDSRILKSSIEFRKKCKELLLNERQEFLKLARKNSKKRLE
jgi:hypothetical protein